MLVAGDCFAKFSLSFESDRALKDRDLQRRWNRKGFKNKFGLHFAFWLLNFRIRGTPKFGGLNTFLNPYNKYI